MKNLLTLSPLYLFVGIMLFILLKDFIIGVLWAILQDIFTGRKLTLKHWRSSRI